MADRYEDRERYEGGRSQDAGRRGEFERGNQGRNFAPGGGQNQGGFNQGGERNRSNEYSFGEYGSGHNEGRYNDQGQYGSDFNDRGDFNENRGFNQGNRSSQNDRQRAWDWDRSRERSMTQTYPRQNEWSSGGGVSTGLGGAENSEYSGFTGPSSYYGGAQGQYGGGTGQGNPGMGGFNRENERSGAGHHIGRGPKGYKRSDDRIREDVNERLTQDPHIDAGEIEVQVKDGEVTLTGMVDNRSTKRRAEEIIENLSGVREVHNQLRAQSSQQDNQSSSRGKESADGKAGSSHQTKS